MKKAKQFIYFDHQKGLAMQVIRVIIGGVFLFPGRDLNFFFGPINRSLFPFFSS
jgi:hypothetical protein